jgi:hypothetical protein
METSRELNAAYTQLDLLLQHLQKRNPLNAEIRQAANDFNLVLRLVQRELPRYEVVTGMRELMEKDTVVELISHATALVAILRHELFD